MCKQRTQAIAARLHEKDSSVGRFLGSLEITAANDPVPIPITETKPAS
jgi:hypothetical protein